MKTPWPREWIGSDDALPDTDGTQAADAPRVAHELAFDAEALLTVFGVRASPLTRAVWRYFAAAGNAGSLPMSRMSCWMMTVALRFATICFMRSIEATVAARSKLNHGTPLLS